MIVIDACVAVKWFIPEPMSDEAEALLETTELRVAPEHILVEVGEALLRHYRRGTVTLDHALDSVEAIGRLVRLVPTRELASDAIRVAAEASCTNYDALYVAASDLLGGTLVTADARLAEQLRLAKRSDRVRLLGQSGGF